MVNKNKRLLILTMIRRFLLIRGLQVLIRDNSFSRLLFLVLTETLLSLFHLSSCKVLQTRKSGMLKLILISKRRNASRMLKNVSIGKQTNVKTMYLVNKELFTIS